MAAPQETMPAFQFYGRDFLARTAQLTLAERGALITLWIYQWYHYRVPDHPEQLSRILGLERHDLRKVMPRVRPFFDHDPVDKSLRDPELEAIRRYHVSRRLNGEQGGRPKKTEKDQPEPHTTDPPVTVSFDLAFAKRKAKRKPAFASAFASAFTSPPTPLTMRGSRLTREERAWANRMREIHGGCHHDPECPSTTHCIARLVAWRRAEEQTGLDTTH
jgi:uncharacterized protein YdaU (DUF1376 family)